MTTALALLVALLVPTFAQDKTPKQEPPKAEPVSPQKDSEKKPRDPFEVSVPTYPNASCPIMGKPISSTLFTDTQYGRIYICCKACAKKIRQDPETAYKTAYPTTKKIKNPVCPIMGESNEGSDFVVLLQGHEIALCCDHCVAKAQANAQTTLVKALDSTVKDVGNETCPITGEAVASNAFCLIGDNLVHLSSPTCVDEVKKDPKGTLEKAKKIAEAKPKEPSHGDHDKDSGGAKKPAGGDGHKHGG